MLALLGAILPAILSGLTSFVQWSISTKAGRITALILIGLAVGSGVIFYERYEAAKEEKTAIAAKEQKETQAEHARRDQALQAAQKQAATTLARLTTTESRNEALQAKIRQLAAKGSKPCFDAGSYQNLLGGVK
jgi:uncharacterized protein HemX